MKKTGLTAAIAAAFTAAGLAACTPPTEPQQKVYGPPPDFDNQEVSETAAESTLSGNEADHDGDTSDNTGDEQ